MFDMDDFMSGGEVTPVTPDITRDPVELQTIADQAVLGSMGGFIHYALIGSCLNPNVAAKDVDVLVLVETVKDVAITPDGFTPCAVYAEQDAFGDGWTAYRRDDVNLIVCHNATFYTRWVQAAKWCAELDIRDRRLRVLVHELHRDGTDFGTAVLRAKAARQ